MPTNTPNICIDALPTRAREIADVIGIDSLLKLASAAKNRHVYVPKLLKADSNLVELVGWVIAQKLFTHFAGELLHVPTCWFSAVTDEGIAAMRKAIKEGATIATIARITGLSQSGVRVALARSMRRAGPPVMGPSGGGGVRVENGHKQSVVSEK